MTLATLPARAVPMSDRDLAFHRTAVRLGLIVPEYKYFDMRRSVVFWNADMDAFVIESSLAADAVSIADQIEAEHRIEVRIIGRKHTARSVSSQYLVCAGNEPEAA